MYLEYFSLKRHPFRITPDPSLFFPGGAHGRGVVLDALVYGIMTGEGILKVVGEVGSGKTMLCRMLEEKLPANVEIVYLANPSLTARDIVYAIAFELKLEVDSATDRLVVMHKLQDYLLQRHAEGASVVVFIEEAQSMPLETLEEIRLLSNLETHRHKLMQIVLFGQPELDEKLDLKAIRQLRERITHSFYLQPLNSEEVREYLHFRLQNAGCPWPQLFSPRAEKLIATTSGGLTRRINIIADKSLLAAYADPRIRPEPRNSSGEIQSMVLPRHVKVAIADSGYNSFRWASLVPWGGYALAAVAVLALGVVLWRQPQQVPASSAAAASAVAVAQAAAAPSVTAAVVAAPVLAPPELAVIEVAMPEAEVVVPVIAVPVAAVPVVAPQAKQAPQLAEAPEPMLALNAVEATPAVAESVMEAAAGVEEPALQASVSDPLFAVEPQSFAAAEEPAPAAAPEPTAALEPTPEIPAASSASTSAKISAPVVAEPAPVAPGRAPSLPLAGLAQQRSQPSSEWLDSLASKSGYTIQVFAVATRQPQVLEEFLEFLALTDLLDTSYICVISANDRRPEQWLVMHGEFAGLSEARRFIQTLPPYMQQYQPYTRNLNDIACAQ
jgi:MSHA biogenesis protein MshM